MIQYLIVLLLFISAVAYLLYRWKQRNARNSCGDCCRCGTQCNRKL